MSQLKDIYNEDFVQKLINTIKTADPAFDRDKCRALIFQEDWSELALKQRMRRITDSLYETLPKRWIFYIRPLPILRGFPALFFPIMLNSTERDTGKNQ